MGPRPPGYTVERKENDKGYTPKNCRWATRKEQAYNTRRNHYLTFRGKTQIMLNWAVEVGIRQSTILQRLDAGWSVSRALGTGEYPTRVWDMPPMRRLRRRRIGGGNMPHACGMSPGPNGGTSRTRALHPPPIWLYGPPMVLLWSLGSFRHAEISRYQAPSNRSSPALCGSPRSGQRSSALLFEQR